MAGSHEAHLDVLTDAEREALERPGLKQRARAITAATEFATRLGLSEDTHTAMVARLRELDGSHARLAWRTLGDANELLEMLLIDTAQTEVAEEVVVNELQVPDSDASEESRAEPQFDLRKVQKFYESINNKTEREWLTPPERPKDIDSDEIMGLIALYAIDHRLPNVVSRQIDKMYKGFAEPGKLDAPTHSLRYQLSNKIAELLDHIDDEVTIPQDATPATASSVDNQTVALQEPRRVEATLSIHEMIERLADGGEERSYRLDRVESLIDQLRRRGVDLQQLTAEDFNNGVLVQLANMYAESVTSSREIVDTNIACTWGWLSGVEMEDLVHMRRTTKLDATSADVHNSRTAFLEGVRKGAERGMRVELTEVELDEEELEIIPDEPAVVESLHIVPPLEESPEEVVVAVRHERSLDEEPKHVQLVARFIERLEMTTVNRRAFEELLNPNTRGEMVPAKTVILEVLRQRIGAVSPDGEVINQLEVSGRAKSAVRQLVGMGFKKHGEVVERDPVVLKDQLTNIAHVHRQGYINDFYAGLEALLEELVTPEAESEKSGPLQIVFSNGKPQLA